MYKKKSMRYSTRRCETVNISFDDSAVNPEHLAIENSGHNGMSLFQ